MKFRREALLSLSSGRRSAGSSMLNHLKAESRELLGGQTANEGSRIKVETWVAIIQILLRLAFSGKTTTIKTPIAHAHPSTPRPARRRLASSTLAHHPQKRRAERFCPPPHPHL